jgi:hypothetical protein
MEDGGWRWSLQLQSLLSWEFAEKLDCDSAAHCWQGVVSVMFQIESPEGRMQMRILWKLPSEGPRRRARREAGKPGGEGSDKQQCGPRLDMVSTWFHKCSVVLMVPFHPQGEILVHTLGEGCTTSRVKWLPSSQEQFPKEGAAQNHYLPWPRSKSKVRMLWRPFPALHSTTLRMSPRWQTHGQTPLRSAEPNLDQKNHQQNQVTALAHRVLSCIPGGQ